MTNIEITTCFRLTFCYSSFLVTYSLLKLSTDDGKDHHEHSEQKVHLQTFDEATENTIKKVKEALKNGEGCRV